MNKFLCAFLATLCVAATVSAQETVPIGTKIVYVPAFRTYMASGYTPSERNIDALKGLQAEPGSLRLLAFDTAKNNSNLLMCRMSYPVYGPNKTPFASLVEAAANMELVQAGLAAQDAPKVTATLDEFDFSSFGTGKWKIQVTLKPEGREPRTVRHEYSYPVNAGAAAGCTDVTNALVLGLESFLDAMYRDARFVESMKR